MIDLVPLIDRFGEPQTALIIGAGLGLAFGIFAQRSAFCTRSAVLGVVRRQGLAATATWLLGFAAALLAVQALLWGGYADATETRFFSTAQSLSGALIGGLIFGAGMVLARGCVSRHLVLAASGNLRALATSLIIAVTGLATYGGVLGPLRDAIGGLFSTAQIGGNDLLAHVGLAQGAGVVIGAALLAAAAALAWRARLSPWRAIGGLGVGLTVAAGWYLTYALSTQVFEPIQAESLSFIRPLATTGALASGAADGFGLDQGVLIGTLVGAFLAALLFGEWRPAGFREAGAAHPLRYIGGGAMMGFGGIVAVGCTIGAGLTGGSVLAVSSLLGLAAMIVGAAVTDRLIERDTEVRPVTDYAASVPAE